MRILVSGSGGLVGRALGERLRAEGHQLLRLQRRRAVEDDSITWLIDESFIDRERMDENPIDAVIHLAGESIMGRWSARKKQAILDSRVNGTRLLSEALAGLQQKPGVMISASAVGYYGDRGDEEVDESSESGRGFLARVCREWEQAAEPAREAGIRVVHPRIGMVLSTAGGALKKMLPVFRLGGGGRIGDGRQYMSWIGIQDLVDGLVFLLGNEACEGPFNFCAPGPVTNAEFTAALARILRRPAVIPVPAGALRLLFGEMADELLLGSTRAVPARLLEAGYAFSHADLDTAFKELLNP